MNYQLTEIVVEAIIDKIRSDIPQALFDVNSDRADGIVNLLPPQDFFYYETNHNYRKPACFVMAESLDFRLQNGANHINSNHDINVAVVLEDVKERDLTLACWRYQAALMKVLHLNQLSGPGLQSKMIMRVIQAKYSPVYSEDRTSGMESTFCKEVFLNLNVEEYEPLS